MSLQQIFRKELEKIQVDNRYISEQVKKGKKIMKKIMVLAVAMFAMAKISEEKGFTKKGSAEKIKEILKKNNLPYEMDINMGEVIHSIELDKKNLGNDLNLILLKEIGNAEIVKSNKGYFEN